MGLGVARAERHRLPQLVGRRGQLPLLAQDQSERAPRLGVPRVRGERHPQLLLRRVEVALEAEREAEIVGVLRITGGARRRQAQLGDGLV